MANHKLWVRKTVAGGKTKGNCVDVPVIQKDTLVVACEKCDGTIEISISEFKAGIKELVAADFCCGKCTGQK